MERIRESRSRGRQKLPLYLFSLSLLKEKEKTFSKTKTKNQNVSSEDNVITYTYIYIYIIERETLHCSLHSTTMAANYFTLFISLISLILTEQQQQHTPRRVLHQPLFPVSSDPPPAPPSVPSFPNPDQPFFPEQPNSPANSNSATPPPPSATANPSAANPLSSQANKPTKKVAIAISVGIVTLGMLSALAFYVYKHRAKPSPENTQKLVGAISQTEEESRAPPATNFLYIGTVEPNSRASITENNSELIENSSPYRKLSSIKRSERYRPSPDLQPLPPLTKPPPPAINSPPPMSSSDEESNDSAFYTPNCSSFSDDLSNPNTKSKAIPNPRPNSIPHSKRTSPKSRFNTSSPNPVFLFSPKKPKFGPPPPPPDMSRLNMITYENPKLIRPPVPPPPPPPPPPLPRPPLKNKLVESENIQRFKESNISESSKLSPRSSFEGAKTRRRKEEDRIDGEDEDELRPKLKPLHWDKVRATSERATVWDQLKSSSFQLNEDMIESLFGCNSTNSAPKEASRRSILPPLEREHRVLDPKKSQNIAILLRALNVTRDEVSEALLDGNLESMGAELLETLVKMAPTKEEEIKLKEYKGDITKLGSAERFLKTVLDIPFAFKRVEAMLYRANFDSELKDLRNSFLTLEAASEELKNSRLFLKLLEAVLRTGNRMNVGTNRGDARAFKLDTLLKLVDVKGTDGKTTLLHFVVQEIIRSEGARSDPTNENQLNNIMPSNLKDDDFRKQGLKIISSLSKELENVKKAANMDSDVLRSYVSKLEIGLEKVKAVLQFEKTNNEGNFFESMREFLKGAGDEISRIKAHERKALSVVKEVTGYFHGDTSREEAHPLRIFMVVRDFLSSLDNVCKEVGKMHDNTVVGSARSFRMPPTASVPMMNRYNTRHDSSSSEESSSP